MKKGNQTIGCNVKSCKHNDNHCCCLEGIEVTPCKCCSGKKEDESMCASYDKR